MVSLRGLSMYVPSNNAINNQLVQIYGYCPTPGWFEKEKHLTPTNFVVIGLRDENEGAVPFHWWEYAKWFQPSVIFGFLHKNLLNRNS